MIPTIVWKDNCVRIIDQTRLPHQLKFMDCRNVKALWKAIRNLNVRGAPALGVAAGFGVLLGMRSFRGNHRGQFLAHLQKVCDYLGTSRPTAVNLFNVLERMKTAAGRHPLASAAQLQAILVKEANAVYEEDRRVCRQMGGWGARLIRSGQSLLTVCNAGALATVDYGTALGVMYAAKERGKRFCVYACETRPLLQGARLTSWELLREGIDTTLICDNMAAVLMKQKKIDAVFAGADRISSNGDTANKIGTYNLAVLARFHRIPFYIVAPRSTFDPKIKNGREIPIEERSAAEVKGFGGRSTAPQNVKAYNPAFDVTDHRLITAIVTERGILRPPFHRNIKKFLHGS